MDTPRGKSSRDAGKRSAAPKYCKVLTIAGSDPSGGAGVQADLKTIAALGCYGLSVITVLTAQNTRGVRSLFPVPAPFVSEQLETLFSDTLPDAVKIGLLHSPEQVDAVADILRKRRARNVVIDPVMASHGGKILLPDESVEAMKNSLVPLGSLITPNLPEASRLVGFDVKDQQDMEEAARALAETGCPDILLKGGHLPGKVCRDLLYLGTEDRVVLYEEQRIATRNTHGTGCTLSSALACFMALGLPVEEAVRRAREYLTAAMRAGAQYRLGRGNGPLHHFHAWW